MLELIKNELKRNNNKLSKDFIDTVLFNKNTKIHHAKVGFSTRVCVITLPSGHELVGYAQVIDTKNDNELLGQEAAYNKAKEQIWTILGTIAKTLVNEVENDKTNK